MVWNLFVVGFVILTAAIKDPACRLERFSCDP